MSIQQYEAPTEEAALDRPRPAGALALSADQADWTSPQQAALAQLGIAEAPHGDQQVFMHVAQRSGLDPFAKQIYLIGRYDKDAPGNKKWTIQTAIDGFRVIAERHPAYAGQTAPQWCDTNGKWTEVWLNRNTPPAAARVGVYRSDREHITWAICHFWEFAGTTRDGSLTKMWEDKGAHQVAKCAEAAALRKAFPQDFSGLYIAEEMEGGGGPGQPVRARAQRATVTASDLTGDAPVPEQRQDELKAAPQRITADQAKRIGALFHEAEVDDKPTRARIVNGLTDRPISGPGDLTAAEADALIAELVEMGPADINALASAPGDDETPDPWAAQVQGDDQ